MKFSVQRDSFAKLLGRAQGIVEKRSTIAVLSHVLLETVGNDEIKLTCTDYDVVLIDQCPARIEQQGRAVVGGKLLFDIVKVLPSVDLEFTKEGAERLLLTAGNSKYNLSGFTPDDFPRFEKADAPPGITIPGETFRSMLAKTAFCMSQDDARLNLNGLYFDFQKKNSSFHLACVATDAHRLAKVEQFFPDVELPFDERGVIVHRKGINEVRKILDSETGDIFLGFAAGDILFRIGSASVYVREIDEEYPDYQSVLPTSFTSSFTVEVPELLDGMRRVLPLTDPNLLCVKMEVTPNLLILSSANAQTGSGQTSVYCEYEGEPFIVGFNHRYLQEAISVVESPKVVFKITEPGSPCLVEPSEPEEKVIFLLMPVEEV